MAYPTKIAMVHGDDRVTYSEMADLARLTASALRASGIGEGDRVAYLCPNIPQMLSAHFAVPLLGAVLVAINTRLSTDEIRDILDHSGSKLLVGDTELLGPLESIVGGLETVEEIVAVDETATSFPFETTTW